MSSSPFEKEAAVFGRYLLRDEPNAQSVQLYVSAMQIRPVNCTMRDEKIIRFALQNSGCLAMIDGALAFSKRPSALREKMLVMTAILETQPAYANLFLPQQRAAGYRILMGFRLCGAAFRLLAGKMLLVFI
ncbi:MAG: hypothetical protein FD123_2980 [Bacteroidetes bacterium]|nr:MAG: hypothetical protein FD123_2980 [Bacteroidota bacterium]